MLETGEYTILDLNSELISRLKQKATKQELDTLEELRQEKTALVHWHRQIGQRKRRAIKNLMSESDNLSNTELKKRLSKIEKDFYYPKTATKIINNRMNMILKKEFSYVVADGYDKKAYIIKASTLKEKENPALFLLKRLERKIIKGIEQEKKGDKKHLKGLKIFLKKVRFNIDKITSGREYTKEQQEEMSQGTDGNYLILIEIVGESIEFI